MFPAHRTKPSRRGVTLIELLVVIAILVALATVTIPAFRPAAESRRTREAARQVNVAFGAAQVQAMHTGSAAGVRIVRESNAPQAGTLLYRVQVPSPYAGETVGAKAAAQRWVGDTYFSGVAVVKIMFREGDVAYPRIQLGDMIQFGLKGPYYRIVADPRTAQPLDFPVDNDGFIKLNQSGTAGQYLLQWRLTAIADTTNLTRFDDATNPTLTFDPDEWHEDLTFKVIRQPMPTAAQPVRLDKQMAIDLAFSGMESNTSNLVDSPSFQSTKASAAAFPDTSPVTILFSPTGELRSLWVGKTEYRNRNLIHLLIGRRDRVPQEVFDSNGGTYTSPAEDGLLNWQDLNNRWITISPSNGLITTSELSAMPSGGTWKDSRIIAREGQTLGGR